MGTSSSTRATQTSSDRQSSQYLVELRLDGLIVASVSVSEAGRARLAGSDDESPLKRIPIGARVLPTEGCCRVGIVGDTLDVSFCSSSLLDPSRIVRIVDASTSDDEPFVGDLRYC